MVYAKQGGRPGSSVSLGGRPVVNRKPQLALGGRPVVKRMMSPMASAAEMQKKMRAKKMLGMGLSGRPVVSTKLKGLKTRPMALGGRPVRKMM